MIFLLSSMHIGVLIAMLFAMAAAPPARDDANEGRIRQIIAEIDSSGRVLQIEETRDRLADPRHQVAPGAPPLLAFRQFQGLDRYRFGKLDLMLDDAGH